MGLSLVLFLPYLDKEESIQLIHDAFNILEPKGALYLSTMEDDYEKSGMKSSTSKEGEVRSLFMHFHEQQYLYEAMVSAGFINIQTERVVSEDKNGDQVVDLILTEKKVEVLISNNTQTILLDRIRQSRNVQVVRRHTQIQYFS